MRIRPILCLLSMLTAPILAQTPTQPTIVGLFYRADVRIMGTVTLELAANGSGRQLVYEWSLLNNPTGACRIAEPTSPRPTLEVWQNPQNPSQGLGQTVQVKVSVSFADAVEGVDAPAERTANILLSSINHPPVPIIDGRLGTEADPIRSGQVVQLNSFKSNDGDGGTNVRAEWGLGTRTGGRFTPIGPALFGSEGAIFGFTVPDMTGPMQLKAILALIDGLYTVQAEAVLHLAPADSTGGSTGSNHAPTLTVAQSTVTVVRGGLAQMQATGVDADGNDLAFTWLFLQGGATSQLNSVSTFRSNSTAWLSTLSYPTATLTPGTYQFSVQASETGPSPLRSPVRNVNLVVAEPGGGTGLNQTQNVCSENTAPSLVSVSPDPRLTQILLHGGETSTVEIVVGDQSEVASPLGGTQKGISGITWNTASLTALGVTASSELGSTTDPYQARSVLTLNPGQSASGTATVSAEVTDVAGCSNTFSFQISVQAAATNEAPQARLRYDKGLGYVAATNGATVETTSAQVQLDAGQSTDDGGTATLQYSWRIDGPGQLSKSTGATNTLTLANGSSSPAVVTLTVRDAGGLSSMVAISFRLTAQNDPPVARLRYNLGNGMSEPAETGATVQTTLRQIPLDAGASTDDGGAGNLQFTWSVDGPASLSEQSGSTTTLSIAESATTVVVVTLTARDASEAMSTTNVRFQVAPPNQAPVAALKLDPDGDGLFSGPFTEDQSIGATSRTILLDASDSTDDGGADSLTYQWEAQGIQGVSVSPADASQSTLTVPSGEGGTVVVSLTVRDAEGLSDSLSLNLQFAAASNTPEAQITGAPEQVEAGQDFGVEGSGSGGIGTGEYRFVWSASDSRGDDVEVYSTGNRARVFAPLLEGVTEESLTITLTVYLDGVPSEPATAQVRVTSPTLYFAQLAVGNINAELQFETSIVLVNNSDNVAHAEITLINNEFGESWSVLVNGTEQSAFAFDIPPDGAQQFRLTGEDVELGWMTVASNVPLTGHLFYQVVDRGSRRVVREAPILPSVGRGFRTAMDPGSNDNLALAVVNLGQEAIRFRLVIRSDSNDTMESNEFVLGPQEHMARFLSELFDGVQNSSSKIPASFQGGTLAIEVVDGNGDMAATIMKTDEGLPLSILPVATW